MFHVDELEHDVMLCRFLHSITAMRRLCDDRRCPDSIIRLHHVETAALAFSMDYASRGTLDQAPLHEWTLHKKIDTVFRLCQAMALAHGLGVIHRDLKPNNVLLAEDDRPVITDFDLAALRYKGSTSGRRRPCSAR